MDRYEKFFGLNIDELIYSSADISIFEKNSYFTEDISMVPGDAAYKKATNQLEGQMINQQQHPQVNPIDLNKLSLLFNRA